MFNVFTAVTKFAGDAIGSLFGSEKNAREQAIPSSGKEDLDLVEKYGGFLSNIGGAARAAMGQDEDAYTPFKSSDDLSAPRVPLGNSRAAQAPAIGNIQSSRLNLAVQTAMRRKTQTNMDFQRLISQNMTQPRPVRGKRTLGIEPARLPSVQTIRPAEVRKESE